ncbi:hypothetical protein SETIT_4G035100v2 [Setaria italica]|uniref:Protein kinase domain-containing protein n=2 Tax=Setaria italica TaxID=4555 RepID=A0A368QQS5_SETIT|nr:uncharacterized protein LOC101769334 isoform X1 [Setaria italica]RCV20174.1 hypothetical protein SETIT_4G035100v2 [Setaria italica]
MELEDVTFQVLKDVTNGFSEKQKLGEGAYGVVYRGLTKNGEEVAVKKLRDVNPDLDDKQFQNEFYNLMKLKHNNIVQILGYCYEIEQISIEHNGRIVLAEKTYRALCFEYLHNGSLQKHISDEHCGLDWHTRYKIIKGICEGLKYIHEELEKPLYHLDLKPDNILLDKDMVPKIADFGLSKIFGKELTRTSQSPLGTCGYQPPEYIERGEISKKFDIFSLGVLMIKIVSGPEGYSKSQNMSYDEFIDQVQNNWRNMLQETWSDSLLEGYCHQVQRCTQIALKCLEKDSQKRPDIMMIIDMLNKIETDTVKLPHKGCHGTVPSMTMLDTVTKMRTEQPDITNQYQHFNSMMTSSRCNDQEFVDTRKKTLDAGEGQIVGRTEEKEKIIAALCTKEKIIVLPIYGIGGIGKTTFAKLIYEDTMFKYFSRAWVYVSPRFDLNKIGNSVISQLSVKESKTNEKHEMDNILTKILSNKKILIVLDDLWEDNPFQMKDLKAMLSLGDKNNIIVLVTTRSEHIAKNICVTLKPYKIRPLTNDMCWDIIKQRSHFETRDDREELMGIGREIALKCGGVALAAQSLGYMLQSMKSDEWEKVKENDIWNEYISKDGSSPNHVLASLKLSYSSMGPCLTSCFTYCAVFPKGHKIVKDDLIHQWISLGFIKPKKILSPTQLCEKYIVQLLGLSFLQHSVLPTTLRAYNNGFTLYKGVTVFTMHDLVHDMARLDMADEILDGSKQGITVESTGRYVLLTDCSKPLKSSTCFTNKIRALRFLDCSQIELHGDAFSSATSLQVLDLSECCIYQLPACISELVKLRYLNAPKIQSQTIPYCITKLSKLIYLNLSKSRMLALPESIGDLRCLMYLDISNCDFIDNLPKSFVNLKRLEYLDLSNNNKLRGVSKALGGLTNIQYLNLSMRKGYVWDQFLEGLPEVIGNLIGLRYLGLSHTTRSIFWNPSSDELFSFIDRICTLSNLQHLDLSNNDSIVSVPESIGNLRNLHTLDLSCCSHLVRLPECLVRMDNVKILNVTGCRKLEKSALSRSKIFDLLPHFVVQADEGESSSNIGLLQYANPNELHITCLDNVKSAEEVQSIKLIEKQGINDLKLQWTSDACRSVEDMEVMASLVPPSTLREFNMTGYNSVSFPPWLMNIKLYLPELSKIELWHICKCNSLPALGQLQNLRELIIGEMDSITIIEEDFCGGARAFPQLKRFCLYHMENLEAWKTMYSNGKDVEKEFMFPNLKELSINDCPKLRMEPCLPRAKKWEIENSNNVLSLWGETRATSSVAPMDVSVTVRSDKAPLDQWKFFHDLPSLSTLHIKCCTDRTCSSNMLSQFLFNIMSRWFTNSNDLYITKLMKRQVINDLKLQWTRNAGGSVEDVEVLGKLVPPSSLREFNMTGYSSMRFPAWVMDITLYLPSLSKIELWDIRKCNSLPPLGQLTNLQELVIGVMDSITTIDGDFCGGERAFPELRKFCLCRMGNLKLWETMYSYDMGSVKKFMFPNLVELLIRDCPNLRLKPCPPRAKRWEIESSDNVLSSWGENLSCNSLDIIGDLSFIKSLLLEDNTQPEHPKWLGGLSSIRKMDITRCKELSDLPGSMRYLTSLQELSLIDCPRIKVLPEWLGDLTALKKLQIRYCRGINSLPQSIQKLTKLKGLAIYHCLELVEWCNLEKNKNMLAHIKVKVYVPPCYLPCPTYLDSSQIKLHGDAFSSATSLQVLDLSKCHIYKLPACISELVKLRYLNAPKIQSQTIPYCITKLSKLIYLNLSWSRMLALPESIGDLRCLMHLDISNCEFIDNLPKSFVNLKRLEYLDLSNNSQLRGLSKALGGLTNIQYLNLSMQIGYVLGQFLEGLPEVIGNLIGLRYLGLSHTTRSIFWNSSSDELFSFIDRICTLSNLQHLDLSNNDSIVSVPESIGNLRNLHTLDLSCCSHLVRLPECLVRMDNVKILNVTGCRKLEKSALSRSKIFDLLPHFVVQADEGESSSNIGLLQYANPNELHITCLDNVKSAEEVQSIKLIEKQGINDLKLQWTSDACRSVEDMEVMASLVPPSTLREFNMTGYNNVSFPPWLMNIKLYLPELSKIELWHICKCNSLPALGQLQNLRELIIGEMDSITIIEEDFCGGARAFPQLKRFCLYHMENLEAWKTMYSNGKDVEKEFMFPNLKELSINDCPKLRMEPCLPRAKKWEIENSNNVLSLWGETRATSSVAPMDVSVTVRSDKAPLDQWKFFHDLPSLSTLHITCCTDPTCSSNMLSQFLFNIMSRWYTNSNDLYITNLMKRQVINDLKLQWTRDAGRSVEDVEVLGKLVPPSSLREFNMTGYNSVRFPAWVMDITLYLPSLSKIELWDIRKCNSLPPLGQLTNLQELVIGVMDSITTIDGDFCGGARAFPELRKFCLCRMGNLKLWETMYSYDMGSVKKFMFPNLVELLIRDCPNLRLKPCPPRAKRLEIESSDNVLSSWGEWGASSVSSVSLTNVMVTVKSSKVPLVQWMLFHHLRAITELRIISCTDLSCNSLDIIGDLSFIKSLWLEDNTQPELPKWLGDLSSIRKMDITGCKELSDLQGSMRHLTSLQELSFIDCPRIKVLPEWLGDLTALKKLEIRYCRGINSLPQSIQKLTKLKVLTIYHCPELAKWCKIEKNKKMLAHIQVKYIFLMNDHLVQRVKLHGKRIKRSCGRTI